MSFKRFNHSVYSHPIFIGCMYACIIRLFVCPVDIDITTDLIGYLGTDTLDTVALRWAFWHPESHFFPAGWSASSVTPNLLDHILFTPLLYLPFPIGDNLWWLGNLWLSCLSAHRYGQTLSNNPNSGWMTGTALVLCDTLIREANWGHSPQAMWWAPVCCLLMLEKWRQQPESRWWMGSGLMLGVSGWCYFYFIPLVVLITLPIWYRNLQTFVGWSGVGLLTISGNLGWLYTQSPEMIKTPAPPLIDGQSLTALHSANATSFWSGTPTDISNQISAVVMIMALFGVNKLWREDRQLVWFGGWSIIFGAGLIAGTGLPLWDWFQQFPFMSRLLWPERCGLLLIIGLMIWTSRASKLIWLLPVAGMEFSHRSSNLPLHTTDTEPWKCVALLDTDDDGALLELPLKDADPLYNEHSLRQRIHKRPLVNPFILPPFVSPPVEWSTIQNQQSIQAVDGIIPFTSEHVKDLQQLNIGFIFVDKVRLSKAQQNHITERLTPTLGAPADLGCGLSWSIQSSSQPTKTSTTVPPYHSPTVDSTQKPM